MARFFQAPDNVATEPDFQYNITLDNGPGLPETPLTVRFRWKERCRGWYFDLFDINGDPIATGQRINAFSKWQFPSMVPPGVFGAIGQDVYAQKDLGTNLLLFYLPPNELIPPEAPLRNTLGP
jgi:hypothetical protein